MNPFCLWISTWHVVLGRLEAGFQKEAAGHEISLIRGYNIKQKAKTIISESLLGVLFVYYIKYSYNEQAKILHLKYAYLAQIW